MGVASAFFSSSASATTTTTTAYNNTNALPSFFFHKSRSQSLSFLFSPKPFINLKLMSKPSSVEISPHERDSSSSSSTTIMVPLSDYHSIDHRLLQKIAYDALVWTSLHGLVVGDKSVQNSGSIPGVGLVHAPFALLPTSFPESHWRQACDLAPIFNELVDRVSLDGKFLQESLSRTKKVDEFTSRLLDIHSKMLEMNKKEDIRLGLHRSDYMLDEQTKSLLQIELNTISSSFAGLSSLVTELHSFIIHITLQPYEKP